MAFSSGGESYDYVEADVSAKQQKACEDPRIQSTNGEQEWQISAQTAARQRKKAPDAVSLLRNPSMRKNLRDSAEFQHVYSKGKRYEGALITVFVIDNRGSNHRLGVTASRRALGKAVQRNRAKRLLREAFRTNQDSLQRLSQNYDWVLNAKTRMLGQTLGGPAQEFKDVVEKVRNLEVAAAAK